MFVLRWLEQLKKSDLPDLQRLVLRCTSPLPLGDFEGSTCVEKLREAGVKVVVVRE